MKTRTKDAIGTAVAVAGIIAAAGLGYHAGYAAGTRDAYSPAFKEGALAGFKTGIERGRDCAGPDGCEGVQHILFETP